MTQADVHYIGSISIDEDLMERTDLWPGEKVAVWGVDNRERIETYAIPARAVRDKSSSMAAPRIGSRPASRGYRRLLPLCRAYRAAHDPGG